MFEAAQVQTTFLSSYIIASSVVRQTQVTSEPHRISSSDYTRRRQLRVDGRKLHPERRKGNKNDIESVFWQT